MRKAKVQGIGCFKLEKVEPKSENSDLALKIRDRYKFHFANKLRNLIGKSLKKYIKMAAAETNKAVQESVQQDTLLPTPVKKTVGLRDKVKEKAIGEKYPELTVVILEKLKLKIKTEHGCEKLIFEDDLSAELFFYLAGALDDVFNQEGLNTADLGKYYVFTKEDSIEPVDKNDVAEKIAAKLFQLVTFKSQGKFDVEEDEETTVLVDESAITDDNNDNSEQKQTYEFLVLNKLATEEQRTLELKFDSNNPVTSILFDAVDSIVSELLGSDKQRSSNPGLVFSPLRTPTTQQPTQVVHHDLGSMIASLPSTPANDAVRNVYEQKQPYLPFWNAAAYIKDCNKRPNLDCVIVDRLITKEAGS